MMVIIILWILPVERCAHIEIVKWKVAFSQFRSEGGSLSENMALLTVITCFIRNETG